MNSDAVTIGYVHEGEKVDHEWHKTMWRLFVGDLVRDTRRIARGGIIDVVAATDALDKGRNWVAKRFLTESDAPWLFFVDTDMSLGGDALEQLIASADPIERPIVGALYFGQQTYGIRPSGGLKSQPCPILYDWRDDPDDRGFIFMLDYPRDQLVRAAATGGGAVLIHRSVFERMSAEGWEGHWFSYLPMPNGSGERLSEDMSFFLRCRELGIPLYVDTRVKADHRKPRWVGEPDYQPPRPALSVLVPWRSTDPHRVRVWEYVRELWSRVPGVELCVADDGGAEGEPFNMARAANAARAVATSPRLLLMGADYIPPTRAELRDILAMLDACPWAMPYGSRHAWSEAATARILAGEAGIDDVVPDGELLHPGWGAIAAQAEAWDRAGGMDERFSGWGHEDAAFMMALDAVCGEHVTSQHVLRTLWHPPASRKGVGRNQALLDEYRAAREAGRLLEYLAESVGVVADAAQG